ncbi:RNA 3'-terminal phosphate cyclase [Colletotrichum higginsianum]|uniref:RNA 3'-terminal phosphate cyclase n=2 Tax=Colletotrichum higginsianum TaxID=80884 RepID=H1VWB0_COLHI|nr:RNA 3'-terminal phosphate cyclase [Colletotrichum higginsianum IMI 349063]OBR08387.1 RNA 3'-terminal phosphate cyclase [Colletotrichum higginsianum IMI 349063]TIC95480.1 RNA 3'-terminal phosphate cyclase [Colletotrichum higginsianum]CCF44521.1 RNA 3'-terminal phosphate cyclase [Colletotrichum higginsianum]
MSRKSIEIDGRTGEGGGQLVRVAIALAAVTSQPVRITHVRGNRPSRGGGHGGRGSSSEGGGLKAQHVTAIRWLAETTEADVEGLAVGSSTLTFAPRLPPPAALAGKPRTLKIDGDTFAASTLLILQAVLPFLLYAAADDDPSAPIELEITGGTNVAWSLSYEYLDQVLLPRLEASFGVRVGRTLKRRGWSLGPQTRGSILLTIHPLRPGCTLRLLDRSQGTLAAAAADDNDDPSGSEVRHVDVSIIAPSHTHADMQDALARALASSFPDAEVHFKIVEDSGHDARVYVLLVARSASGHRWGRDALMSIPKKGRQREPVASLVSRRVVGDLAKELAVPESTADEFLQDQLVVFQALAEGATSFPRRPPPEGADVEGLGQDVAQLGSGERMRRDRADRPFGHGSLHAQTARWVTSEILPSVEWYNKGAVCKGVGTKFG